MIDFSVEPITDSNIAQCAELLVQNEKTCVALMSRFVQNGTICVPTAGTAYAVFVNTQSCEAIERKLCAVLLFDNLIFHCIEQAMFSKKNNSALEEKFCHSVRPFIKKKPFGIIGTVFGTTLLQRTIREQPLIKWDYLLFEYTAGNNADFSAPPTDLTLRQCDCADARTLFPLQKQYEIEEVLPPGSQHNALVSISNLQKALKEQLIFALFDSDGKALAKAGTNARGLYWDQLGGVFTEPAYRGRGYARVLTHHLANLLSTKQKHIALFVKATNTQAQRAYIHAGFKEVCPYKIVYY